MSRPTVEERLIERFEARALAEFGTEAWKVGAREVASAVNDEVRHGKPGTVRDANAVFVFRMGKRFVDQREARSSRDKQTLTDRERYADFYVALFDQLVMQRPSPASLARALQAFRASGYPALNPRLADKLLALGERWPSQGLPAPPRHEIAKPGRRHHRSAKEGDRARAGAH